MEINGKRIGGGSPVYIVAEVSANHNGTFDEAVSVIEAASEAGADAVKLQTYTADTLTIESADPSFRVSGGGPWEGRTLHDLYSEASMPWEWQPKLATIADELGLDFFSSAFDPSSVGFLEEIGVPVHKVASFEIVDIPLIEAMAATGKPLIISTGMATLDEIDEAVAAARRGGAAGVALLKCTSAYPARENEMNLRTIPHMGEAFGVPVGLSDHTLGVAAAIAAVALGACIVEKHLTLSRAVPGPDSAFSMEPAEFAAMVDAIRAAERALGDVHYGVSEEESKSRAFRRSLYVVEDVAAGELFNNENVRSIRPAHGLHPRHLPEVLGRAATRDVRRGTAMSWSLVRTDDGASE